MTADSWSDPVFGGRKHWYSTAAASTDLVDTGVSNLPVIHRVYQSIATVSST
ncbi:Uncharacterised protein [Mycobacteroides abscessus subsp. abscessus]|nr:Uncharacterised protein [Mycobacteroides abscessus subsp. abscessus]